ncbi:MinD/ParA family protein (plasmid) [Pseudonocardia sp. DSM 110487]|uniref:MinD/ParA family ATP-binding protein n=1 Tax=Pseudonocardia sp. DSM 110487 TaxID=2865833 RepID=UPI001C6A7034|nr:MinD/ParA family protein [Pseudonocardia sp. DSM 110487]QYN41063.1 MinD/ParA family protein [Pseudonocardia sp. DSM 110487]
MFPAQVWPQPGSQPPYEPGDWDPDSAAVMGAPRPDWGRLAPAEPPAVLAPGLPPGQGYDFGVSAGDLLTDEALVRQQRPAPTEGWRLAVYAASGGRINPGQSPQEAARLELIHRIRRPLPAPHRVAVISVKGGVGKTTVAASLGLVFAELRGDRVVALDANPDAGTLSERLTGPGGTTVRDLYEDMPNLESVAEITRYVRAAGRLHVLGSEQEPAMGEAFSADEYLEVTSLLNRFYNIIITDSGTGMVHSAMEATLRTAHSLVVVGSPTVDGANRASRTLSFLVDEGYRAAAEQAVVVLCGDRHSPDVDRTLIRSHFAARCRAVVDIPPDPHLATGGRINPGLWQSETRDAWYLLAAHVADGFGVPSPSPAGPPAIPPGAG